MKELETLSQKQDWNALFDAAAKLTRAEPKQVVAYGYAAHALRQLQRLEEGFEWAQRGLEIDDENLFVLNRASLLANLTQRHEVAWNLAVQNAARRPVAESDQFNLAILLVNGIHCGAKLNRIDEAVTRFTPAIEALDHLSCISTPRVSIHSRTMNAPSRGFGSRCITENRKPVSKTLTSIGCGTMRVSKRRSSAIGSGRKQRWNARRPRTARS